MHLINFLNFSDLDCFLVKKILEDQEQSYCGHQDYHNEQTVLEKEGGQVDPLTEGRYKAVIVFLMKKGPVASDGFKFSDLVEVKVKFIVEYIREIDKLKVRDYFDSYHFMTQTQEKNSYSDVGNHIEYCFDCF